MKKRERLNGAQLTELQEVIRSNKSSNTEIRRAQSILLINNKTDEFTLKSVTGFSQKYAFRLKKRYQERGFSGIATKKKKNRLLLTAAQKEEIVQIVKEKKPTDVGINADFWSTTILGEYIKKEYNVVYRSKTSCRLLFKKAGFTYHKPEKHYHSQDKKLVAKWDAEVAPQIQEILNDPNSIVLTGDEMILTTQTTTQKIWLKKGETIFVEASNKREKRCIYGFLNIKTGQQHAFKNLYTNSFTTCKFLSKLSKIYNDKKIVIIWDNASWHKSKMIKNFLDKHPDKFQLFAFPPYSPEKNPQEHVWRAGRSAITHNKFIEDIDKSTNDFVDYLNSTVFDYKLF